MGRDRRKRNEEDEEEPEHFWKGLARDLIIAGAIVTVFLASIYLYAGVWPPLVVVESSSMQHGDKESYFGVIDTGDMVFQQAAPDRASIITYVQGRASGYMTYGEYGDVIIFRRASSTTPVIHRAIMYITVHLGNQTADVPDLAPLPTTEWYAVNATGPTRSPYYLKTVWIRHIGWQHDLNITFHLDDFAVLGRTAGYITMGDNNAYRYCSLSRDPCLGSTPYDPGWLVRQQDIVGRARGEIPWFGLLKLTLQPTDTCCALGWGDPEAPKNSWDALLGSLIFLFALPFILEYAGRGWAKYVAPRLPEIRWPWRRTRKATKPENAADGPKKKPPREGSSES